MSHVDIRHIQIWDVLEIMKSPAFSVSLAEDVLDPITGEKLAEAGSYLHTYDFSLERIYEAGVELVSIRLLFNDPATRNLYVGD